MPRPSEVSPLRRVLEQAIMWIVLAGTVGMAALVDRQMNRLGPPQSIGELTLRLPANWRPTEDHGAGRIELRERGERLFTRTITVRPANEKFSLEALISAPRTVAQEQMALADGLVAKISLLRRVGRDEYTGQALPVLEMQAVITVPRSTPVVVSIRQVNTGSPRDVELNMELLRRILGTVRISQR